MDWLRKLMLEINSQDNRMTATPYYYDIRHEGAHVEGVFLTAKAAEQHLRENQHNLPDNAYVYLAHGGRNSELQTLLENIGKVVGVPYIKR